MCCSVPPCLSLCPSPPLTGQFLAWCHKGFFMTEWLEDESRLLWLDLVQQGYSSCFKGCLVDWGRLSCLSVWADFRQSPPRNPAGLIRIPRTQVPSSLFLGGLASFSLALVIQTNGCYRLAVHSGDPWPEALLGLCSSELRQGCKRGDWGLQKPACCSCVRCVALWDTSSANVSCKWRLSFSIASAWPAAAFLNWGHS